MAACRYLLHLRLLRLHFYCQFIVGILILVLFLVLFLLLLLLLDSWQLITCLVDDRICLVTLEQSADYVQLEMQLAAM
jgi:hypothetical protein